jgi:hypothetical protein
MLRNADIMQPEASSAIGNTDEPETPKAPNFPCI